MASPISKAEKIAQGINYLFGAHIVVSCNKFFGREGYLVKMWIVKDSYYDGHTWVDEELFRTTSGAYACLFCRDLLYTLQGRELPKNDPIGYYNVCEKRNAGERLQYMVKIYGKNSFFEAGTATT